MAALENPDVIEEEVRPLLFSSLTPSGIEVAYLPSPRRHYKLRDINIADSLRTPLSEWLEIPSVTTILDCLEKPGLSWYGMTVGVAGVLELFDRKVISSWAGSQLVDAAGGMVGPEDVVRFLTQEKLTVNHLLTKAGDRGTSVHDALEDWCKTGTHPHPEIYPESERPYVEGLCKFLIDFGVAFDIQAEVMVGSLQHLYAGRYDFRCRWGGGPMVTRTYPKRKNKIEELPAGELLIDLKTSSGVYQSHQLQLAAYELASVEDGYSPTDYQYVLHVTKTGEYELVQSKATGDDFLAVLACYRALEDLKGRK
jgi:hypothetical protein